MSIADPELARRRAGFRDRWSIRMPLQDFRCHFKTSGRDRSLRLDDLDEVLFRVTEEQDPRPTLSRLWIAQGVDVVRQVGVEPIDIVDGEAEMLRARLIDTVGGRVRARRFVLDEFDACAAGVEMSESTGGVRANLPVAFGTPTPAANDSPVTENRESTSRSSTPL